MLYQLHKLKSVTTIFKMAELSVTHTPVGHQQAKSKYHLQLCTLTIESHWLTIQETANDTGINKGSVHMF